MQLPKLPQSIDEVHDFIDSINCKTSNGESFVYLNDRRNAIIVYTCKTNLKFMAECTTYYLGGTFDLHTNNLLPIKR